MLQEVRFDINKLLNQAVAINDLLSVPYPYINSTISRFYRPSVGDSYREGLAILSRHPIRNIEVIALNQTSDDKHTRIIQITDIIFNETVVNICNVHFSNNHHSVEQLSETLSIIKSLSSKTIISGDFNIPNLSEFQRLYSKDFSASNQIKQYVSFPSKSETLDYVLIPKTMKYTKFDVFPGLSDHSSLCFSVDI